MYLAVWRPLDDGSVHNILVLGALILSSVSLVYASSSVATSMGWLKVGVSAVVIGFLVRSLPVVILPEPPLHDGYFYLVSLLNVADADTLQPEYQAWYSQIAQQLNWPVLQLLATQLHAWSGLPLDSIWRFLPAGLGSLTYFAIGLLAYQVFGNWRTASVAGILGGFTDLVLYYQSEFQPQGLAILAVLFFLFLILASRDTTAPGVRVLMLLTGAAVLFTHHASTLMLSFIVAPLLALPLVARGLASITDPTAAARPALTALNRLADFRSVAVLLIVATATVHFFYFDGIARLVLTGLDPATLFNSHITGGDQPEWWVAVLRLAKYGLFGLGLMGLVVAVRSPTRSSLLLAVLSLGLFIGAGLGLAVFPSASTRFLALALPVAAIFAGHFVVRRHGRIGNPLVASPIGVIALGLLVAAGIMNSQGSLAYLLVDPPRTAGTWYGGALPRTDLVAQAGAWIQRNDRSTDFYAVDFSTRMAPFYYGHVTDSRIRYDSTVTTVNCRATVVVVDYVLTAEGYMKPTLDVSAPGFARVFDNGSIAVYRRAEATC
jgi:hypothetical protein